MINADTNLNILDLLGVLFIAFKLAGIIGWSWIWVLSPLIVGYGFPIVLSVVTAWIKMKKRQI